MPETIDDEDNGYTNTDNPLPEELSIQSISTEGALASEYTFDTPGYGSIVWNNNLPIAPDRENTEWTKKEFQMKERAAKKVCLFSLTSWLISKVLIIF